MAVSFSIFPKMHTAAINAPIEYVNTSPGKTFAGHQLNNKKANNVATMIKASMATQPEPFSQAENPKKNKIVAPKPASKPLKPANILKAFAENIIAKGTIIKG